MKRITTATAVLALLAVTSPAYSRSPQAAPEEIPWYYDAETALQVAKKTERPIVLLKVRADIGPDVKT